MPASPTHIVHGPINLDETLHLLANAKLVTGTLGAPLGITLNIANGDFVMESGALIDGNVAGCNTGGNITVTVDNGNVDMKTGSIIRSNSCSGGAIAITTTGSHTANIDGTVESVGSITGTGGSQRPGGGTITVIAGCGLTVGDTGIVSSRGKDPGADLVHLQGCNVAINGLVESTGPGHVLPSNPAESLQPAARAPRRAALLPLSSRPASKSGPAPGCSSTTRITTARSMPTRGRRVAPAGAAGSTFTRGRTSPSGAWSIRVPRLGAPVRTAAGAARTSTI